MQSRLHLKKNSLIHCAVGLLATSLFAQVFAAEISEAFSKGPYLQNPTQSGMTIMWESAAKGHGRVLYGLEGKMDQEFRLETPMQLDVGGGSGAETAGKKGKTGKKKAAGPSATKNVYLYACALKDLKPGAVYSYSVEMAGQRTAAKQFKTFGPNQEKVTFIAYGDTRSQPDVHEAIVKNFKKHSPQFILHTGDLVAKGTQYELWGKEFFNPLKSVMDEVPLFAAMGNHEEDGINYFRYLELPGMDELYDLQADPYELDNLVGSGRESTLRPALETEMMKLRRETGDGIGQ